MSEFKRDMDEIWIEIEKATDDIDVPDSLLPERIVEELKQNEKKKERRRMRRITEMAAAVAVVVAVGGVGIYQMNNSAKFTAENAMMQDSVDSVQEAEIAESTMDMAMSSSAGNGIVEENDEPVTKKEKKQKVGDKFHLAKDYDEIYDLIKQLISDVSAAKFVITADHGYAMPPNMNIGGTLSRKCFNYLNVIKK